MPNYVEPILARRLHQRGYRLGLPIAGTFELTPRCNFNCKMCYVHLSEAEQRRRGRELTAEQWIRLGEQAKRAGMVFLLLTGGEPLLRPDFPEIYTALKKMGFMLTINSNGYLICDKLLELFANDPPIRINISLYGTSNETYARMCGIPAYDRIIENITRLRETGVQVKINMSLTPDNMDDMEQVYRQARAMDVNTQASPYMFPPIRNDPASIGRNNRMSPEEAGRFSARYNALCMEEDSFCRLAASIEKGLPTGDGDGDPCEGSPASGVTCRAGSTSFWLTWDGKMMPCGQMVEPVAAPLELGFDEAWRRIREATAAIRLPVECANCKYAHVCKACAAMCYCESGRFDGKPEYVCKMSRAYAAATVEYWKTVLGGRLPENKENQT